MTGEGVTCSFLPFITARRWVGVAWACLRWAWPGTCLSRARTGTLHALLYFPLVLTEHLLSAHPALLTC